MNPNVAGSQIPHPCAHTYYEGKHWMLPAMFYNRRLKHVSVYGAILVRARFPYTYVCRW